MARWRVLHVRLIFESNFGVAFSLSHKMNEKKERTKKKLSSISQFKYPHRSACPYNLFNSRGNTSKIQHTRAHTLPTVSSSLQFIYYYYCQIFVVRNWFSPMLIIDPHNCGTNSRFYYLLSMFMVAHRKAATDHSIWVADDRASFYIVFVLLVGSCMTIFKLCQPPKCIWTILNIVCCFLTPYSLEF